MPKIIKHTNFTVIGNEVACSKSLSLKAKGLLAYLLSKPNDWDFSASRMTKELMEGRDAILSGLRELETAKLLYRDKKADGTVDYHISSDFDLYPKSENPTVGKPHGGKTRPINKKDIYKERLLSKDNKAKASYGNELVNFVLEEFKNLTGFEPTDPRPRNHASNLSKRVLRILKEKQVAQSHDDLVRRAKGVIQLYFAWLGTQDWDVQKMQTAYHKFKMYEGLVILKEDHA